VPQGSEYKAVCRGLSRVGSLKPLVLPIPVGTQPVTKYLERLQQTEHLHYPSRVLLMGLCGSLSPDYAIGDSIFYRECVYESNPSPLLLECDRALTTSLQHKLRQKSCEVRALTSDRLIWSRDEKRKLGQIYAAGVVDMEGFATLKVLAQAGVSVAMIRVVSDDCYHNLPDLTSALSPDGLLQPVPLALGLLRQPVAAAQLIRGALRGLQVLQQVTTLLFSD